DEGTNTGGQSTWTLKNLTPGEVIFIRVTATNAGGESLPGPTLAVGVAQAGQRANLLLVGGFDRFDTGLNLLLDYTRFTQVHRLFLDRMNDGMLLATYGRALRAKGIAFDAAWRDAVGTGIDLKAYRAILWAAAKGATEVAGLTDDDIEALANAAQAGVSLLISGSTVAKSLAASTSPAATALLGEHLAAALGTEGQTHTSLVPAETSGVLHGLGTLPLGDTAWRPFPVGPVDTIAATAQGEVTASYGAGGGALVESRPGHACSLLATFPLAALGDDDRRAEAIAKVATHCPIDGGGTAIDGGPHPHVDAGPTDASSGDIPPSPGDASKGDGDGETGGGGGGCDCRVAGTHRRSGGKAGGDLPTAIILLGLFLVTRVRRRHRRPRRP
ncbi:MAG: fibronectin type III domain-containing protein, partial [Deltaproteobacteria bacterium]|nr:fibronectin type III domain-containing protein [Deltaproteobacteria bacterium]